MGRLPVHRKRPELGRNGSAIMPSAFRFAPRPSNRDFRSGKHSKFGLLQKKTGDSVLPRLSRGRAGRFRRRTESWPQSSHYRSPLSPSTRSRPVVTKRSISRQSFKASHDTNMKRYFEARKTCIPHTALVSTTRIIIRVSRVPARFPSIADVRSGLNRGTFYKRRVLL